jgi:hypothetical protein
MIYEDRLLAECITNPSLEGRKQAREALGRYYYNGVETARGELTHTVHEAWYRDYRRDGTLRREGGSRTTTTTLRTF